MKNLLKKHLVLFGIIAFIAVIGLIACDDGGGGGGKTSTAKTPQELADAFKAEYSEILAKPKASVTLEDEADIVAALTAYGKLAQNVKNLLTAEKAALDDLKSQIDDLKSQGGDTAITSVNIHITPPVFGDTPNTTATTTDTNYEVGTVAWTPAVTDNKFGPGVKYTATVTLTANEGYTFTGLANANVKINTSHTAKTVTPNQDGTITVSYEFDETDSKMVDSIEITVQPETSYTHGDTLDLTGLKVKIIYSDVGFVEVEFGVDEGHGLDFEPEHGDTLSHTLHDGKPVKVSYGQNVSENTDNLTVAKADPDVTWPSGLEAIKGWTLSEVILTGLGESDVPGTFTWTDPTASVNTAGTVQFEMTFTPDSADYNTLTEDVDVLVVEPFIIDIGMEGTYPGNVQTQFTASIAVYDAVEFIGERTDVTSTLTLAIPAGKMVEWKADLTVTGATVGITLMGYTEHTGTFEMTEGSISAATGRAIFNSSSGHTVNIVGGTVSATSGSAIYNNNIGAVNISGGTVSATTGNAIYNNSTGLVTISQADTGNPTLITSANVSNDSGTIYLATATGTAARLNITGGTVRNTSTSANSRTIYNASTGAMNISGGTVSATAGRAIFNYSTAVVNVSGGTVSATTGVAIYNDSTGRVNISQADAANPTVITSANVSGTSGTIYLYGTGSAVRLNMTGGTVTNTGSNANAAAIYTQTLSGTINISGGTVSALGRAIISTNGAVNISGGTIDGGSAIAISIQGTGLVTISQADAENPTLVTSANVTNTSGTIQTSPTGTGVILRITGGTVQNTGNNANSFAIYKANVNTSITIDDGTVKSTGANSTYAIRSAGNGSITVTSPPAVITAGAGEIEGQAAINAGTTTVNWIDGE
jgi:hypothetical protein